MTEDARMASPSELQRFVDRQASRLAEGQARRAAWALSTLAALRRGAGGQPGADPTLWDVTLAGLESSTGPDRVTRSEYSAFHALTLFAVHQQSRPTSMHARGQGLGTAFRSLLRARQDNPSTRARFIALAASADPDELVMHLRSVVQLLRGESIQLDYGLLARQISDFHTEPGRTRVRQRWGRELERTPAQTEQPIEEVTAQ